jgi:hypothetical protein
MPEKVRTSIRVREDALEKLERYQDEKALNNRSAAVQHMIFEVDSSEQDAQSRFRFWVEANQLIFTWFVSFMIGSFVFGSVGGALEAESLIVVGELCLSAGALAVVGLVGTLIQQSRVRKTDEGLAYRRQVAEVLEGSLWHLKTVLGIDGRGD